MWGEGGRKRKEREQNNRKEREQRKRKVLMMMVLVGERISVRVKESRTGSSSRLVDNNQHNNRTNKLL